MEGRGRKAVPAGQGAERRPGHKAAVNIRAGLVRTEPRPGWKPGPPEGFFIRGHSGERLRDSGLRGGPGDSESPALLSQIPLRTLTLDLPFVPLGAA